MDRKWKKIGNREGERGQRTEVRETMEALHEIGAVDKKTMREFDQACLTLLVF